MEGVCCSISNMVIVTALLTAVGKNPCGGSSEICESTDVFDYISGAFVERCTNQWIKNDMQRVEFELKYLLFGQHLATETILTSIRGHIENRSPPKALAMSFHGSKGTGKTYASEMIARRLYKEGLKSKFVRRFYGAEFHDNQNLKILQYQNRIRQEIKDCVAKCCQCLFIFDQIDIMPAGILDSVEVYIDYYRSIDGLDYRKSIFLFISNVGSQDITELMLSRWESGYRRGSLKMIDVEPYLKHTAYNTEGGLKHSVLIKHNLLYTFIPFLPLEREHVRRCIQAQSQYRRFDEQALNKLTKSLSYFPEDRKIFSVTGCQSVSEKLDQHDEF